MSTHTRDTIDRVLLNAPSTPQMQLLRRRLRVERRLQGGLLFLRIRHDARFYEYNVDDARADGRAEQWSPLNTGEMIAIVLALEAAKTTTRRIWRRSGTSSGLPPKSRLIFTKEETVERER